MQDAHAFLENVALVLCVAGVTTVVCQRLRQPVVFGYLLAGMIVGPHLPIPLFADEAIVRTLSELGVILLMFALGLEFNLRKLLRVGATAGLIALAETSFMMWLGFLLGRLFGWTTIEAVFAGAIIAISSTTIIVKTFDEQGLSGRFTELVLGILIFEDLFAILLLAILTTIATGSSLTLGALTTTAVRLGTFLAVLVAVGLLLVPRAVRWIVHINRPETTLIASIGICFAAALLAYAFGYSVALGAFIAGSLVSESGEEEVIERLVHPVRDVFVAIFFVAVGMLIDPGLIWQYKLPVLAFTGAVIVGKFLAVSTSSFLSGSPLPTAVRSGMSLTQIGEFSFIIAAVGLSAGTVGEFLYPVAVAVSALTTLTTPWLIRAAGPAAALVDSNLPRPVQTFLALYGSWVERIRSAPRTSEAPAVEGRLIRLLALDTVLLAAVMIGGALEMGRFTRLFREWSGMPESTGRWVVIGAMVAVAIPLLAGILAVSHHLAVSLGRRALPVVPAGAVDPAAAPRSALIVAIQAGLVAVVVVILLATTQPFVDSRVALLVLPVAGALGIAFWRSTRNLHGHARAGAELIASTLSAHLAPEETASLSQGLNRVSVAVPGLGEPTPIRIGPASPAVGKSLAALNLRALTGATILAVGRDEGAVIAPSGSEVLRERDILAVAGSAQAVAAALDLLGTGERHARVTRTAVETPPSG
ncbi:MAG: cation:proton antiporter [Gemmatimonadetes bacterium]|nr:cation:proton antiporter [Gemmatimonadota bacterium]